MRLILERWWMIAAVALLGMVVAYIVSDVRSPVFESSSKYVLATDPAIEDPADVAAALGVLRNRQITATFAEILQSQTLLDRAVREVGGTLSDFDSSGVVLPESNVVSLTVSGPTAESVREVNAIIGDAANEDLTSIYPIYQVIPLESPKTPSGAVSPEPLRDALFGATVGAFLGLVLATLWPVTRTDVSPLIGLESVQTRKPAEVGRES